MRKEMKIDDKIEHGKEALKITEARMEKNGYKKRQERYKNTS